MENIIATIFGIIICLGTVVGLVALVCRFRHSIFRALGIVFLVVLVLIAVAMLVTYPKQLVCLIPLAILIFVIWLFTRNWGRKQKHALAIRCAFCFYKTYFLSCISVSKWKSLNFNLVYSIIINAFSYHS